MEPILLRVYFVIYEVADDGKLYFRLQSTEVKAYKECIQTARLEGDL